MKKKMDKPGIIGWREWVSLPELGIEKIKAKVDTGARSSSLHAVDMKFYRENAEEWVEFKVFVDQKRVKKKQVCCSSIVEYRTIKSSNGQTELRPVILTDIEFVGQKWPIEITLTSRADMGFKMLLGRAGIKKRFLVDAGKSYCGIQLKKKES